MNIPYPKSRQPLPKEATCVFQGKIFSVYQWEQDLFDGSKTIFEKIKRPATVMVLPVTETGKIILTKQSQPAEGEFISSIGGIVDESEDPFSAIRRELLEESGYEAQDWILWDAVQLIGKIEWPSYTFIAKNLRKTKDMNPDAGEKIELIEFAFDEFLTIIADEKFRDIEIALKVLRITQNKNELEKLKQLLQ